MRSAVRGPACRALCEAGCAAREAVAAERGVAVRRPRAGQAVRVVTLTVMSVLCSSMQPCEREKSRMGAILSERRTDASAPARSLG